MTNGLKDVSPEKEKQPWNKKKVLALAVIGVLSISIVVSRSFWYSQTEYAKGLAPDFSLVDIDGNSFTLSSHRGKVVILDFMALGCGTCRSEILELESVWTLHNKTIVIASIIIDFETNERIRTFRNSYSNATWIWITDTANVAEAYDVNLIPKTVIIDKNGIIEFTHVGWVNSQTLLSEIEQLPS